MTTLAASAPRSIGRKTIFLFAAFGGILFGYDLGVISGVLPFIGDLWKLDAWDKGVVTASVSAGAVIGAAASAKINDRIGRRRTIQLAAVIVLLGTIGAVFAPGYTALVVFRTVIGVGVGLSSSTVPTYLSELAPAKLRGALGSLNQIFIVLGILIAFLVSYFLGKWGNDNNWRYMMAGAAIPAIVLFFGLMSLPETPRWLLTKGREQEARDILEQTHGSEASAQQEMVVLQEVVAEDSKRRGLRNLLSPTVLPMLMVAVMLAAGQQLSGVNAINAYFPTMLISLGISTNSALLSGVLLGLSKFIFTAWVVFVVDRWGRKPLLLVGSVLMAITLAAAGFVANEVHSTGPRGVLMLILIIAYLVGYELGWGAVVWVMMSEVFPLRNRAAGMAVSAVVLWAATGLVTAVFPLISAPERLGLGGSMYLFAGINVVFFFLVKWIVPETKGRSLEEIELDLKHGKAARAADQEADTAGTVSR